MNHIHSHPDYSNPCFPLFQLSWKKKEQGRQFFKGLFLCFKHRWGSWSPLKTPKLLCVHCNDFQGSPSNILGNSNTSYGSQPLSQSTVVLAHIPQALHHLSGGVFQAVLMCSTKLFSVLVTTKPENKSHCSCSAAQGLQHDL